MLQQMLFGPGDKVFLSRSLASIHRMLSSVGDLQWNKQILHLAKFGSMLVLFRILFLGCLRSLRVNPTIPLSDWVRAAKTQPHDLLHACKNIEQRCGN